MEKLTIPDHDTDQVNLEKGLIAWYPMNGTSEDVSGNGFNGVVNGATLTKDRFGNLEAALSFDGKDDYLEIPNFDWNERNNCSISLWTKYQKLPEDLGKDYGMIFGMNNESHSLFLHSGKLYFRQGWGNGSINAPTLGTWHNLVLTWNGSLKKVTFYQNSKKVSEHNAYQQVGLKKGTLRIGANDRILNYFFKGSIDDFRIYDRALNADQVLALFELESKPPTDDNPPSPPPTDPGTPPADDYLETIAKLQKQIEQLTTELKDAKEEISQKDETIAELQSTNQELTYENEELRGELAEELEKNDVLTAQVANLNHDNNNLKYELGVATKQAEEAVKMAQVLSLMDGYTTTIAVGSLPMRITTQWFTHIKQIHGTTSNSVLILVSSLTSHHNNGNHGIKHLRKMTQFLLIMIIYKPKFSTNTQKGK